MITNTDVQNLAELARIDIKVEEIESIRKKMEGILAYVSEVQDLAKADVGQETPEIGESHNVLREDTEPHEGGKYTESIIKNAPQKEGDYIKVRKIL